jgi:hypothetical protein
MLFDPCSLTLTLPFPLLSLLECCLSSFAGCSSDVVGIVRFVLWKIHIRKVPNQYTDMQLTIPWKEIQMGVQFHTCKHMSMKTKIDKYMLYCQKGCHDGCLELVLMFIIHNYMYSKYIFPAFPNPKNYLTKCSSYCVPWVGFLVPTSISSILTT